jgi:adenosylhomocysteine nucleosidase
MIAIIAALPREIASLVKGEAADAAYMRRDIALYYVNSTDAVVAAAGMGAERVTLAVKSAMEDCEALWALPVHTLISVGLAGSCRADVRAGEVVVARQVIDARTGERFDTVDGDAVGVLVTDDKIASIQEKHRLAEAYGALMVDMEAATVGRLARAHGLKFRAIKAISDAHDFELESLGAFADRHGQFRTVAFALHTALRPRQWPRAMELGRNSALALAALDKRLRDVIAEARG